MLGLSLTVRLKTHFFSLLVPSGFRCHLLSGKRKISACFRLVTSAPSPGQRSLLAVGTGSTQPTEKLTVLMAVAAAAEHISTGVSALFQIVVLSCNLKGAIVSFLVDFRIFFLYVLFVKR